MHTERFACCMMSLHSLVLYFFSLLASIVFSNQCLRIYPHNMHIDIWLLTHVLVCSYTLFFMLYSIFCHMPIFYASPHMHFTAIPHIGLVVHLFLSHLFLYCPPPRVFHYLHELPLPSPIFPGSQHLSRVLSHTLTFSCSHRLGTSWAALTIRSLFRPYFSIFVNFDFISNSLHNSGYIFQQLVRY